METPRLDKKRCGCCDGGIGGEARIEMGKSRKSSVQYSQVTQL